MKNFQFFVVGVKGVDMDIFSQIFMCVLFNFKGFQFRELFKWFFNFMGVVFYLILGDNVILVNFMVLDGWVSV